MNIESLTLALVIPAYNEERYLKACLDAIAAQSVKPDEVFVVDNNSTDKTVEIASSYNFVTVLCEPRQHQVFAQASGFNRAKSDILARIDADSIVPNDWVEKVKQTFAERPATVAITGAADPYDTNSKTISLFFFNTYYAIAKLIAGHRLLFGANCAIRKSAWNKVRSDVLMRSDIWEDYDLAFSLAKQADGKIDFLDGIATGISLRSVHKPLSVQFEYHFRALRTFYYRTNLLQTALFMLILSLGSLILVYPMTLLDKILNKPVLADKKIPLNERG